MSINNDKVPPNFLPQNANKDIVEYFIRKLVKVKLHYRGQEQNHKGLTARVVAEKSLSSRLGTQPLYTHGR